ncbi:MAG TPA: AMP-binding protein, partial [Acidimicrobiales bacterium]|nr:AMP-binding protein [Acidimicrobiales bacterium]
MGAADEQVSACVPEPVRDAGAIVDLLLEMAADAAPDRVAIGDRQNGITTARLYDLARRAATRIAASGAPRVLFTDVSCPAPPVALFGAAGAGVPFVPLNYRLADDRLRDVAARVAPAIVVADDACMARLGSLAGVDLVERGDLEARLESAPLLDDTTTDPDSVAVWL